MKKWNGAQQSQRRGTNLAERCFQRNVWQILQSYLLLSTPSLFTGPIVLIDNATLAALACTSRQWAENVRTVSLSAAFIRMQVRSVPLTASKWLATCSRYPCKMVRKLQITCAPRNSIFRFPIAEHFPALECLMLDVDSVHTVCLTKLTLLHTLCLRTTRTPYLGGAKCSNYCIYEDEKLSGVSLPQQQISLPALKTLHVQGMHVFGSKLFQTVANNLTCLSFVGSEIQCLNVCSMGRLSQLQTLHLRARTIGEGIGSIRGTYPLLCTLQHLRWPNLATTRSWHPDFCQHLVHLRSLEVACASTNNPTCFCLMQLNFPLILYREHFCRLERLQFSFSDTLPHAICVSSYVTLFVQLPHLNRFMLTSESVDGGSSYILTRQVTLPKQDIVVCACGGEATSIYFKT